MNKKAEEQKLFNFFLMERTCLNIMQPSYLVTYLPSSSLLFLFNTYNLHVYITAKVFSLKFKFKLENL